MDFIGSAKVNRLFLAASTVRIATIVLVIATLSIRPTPPAWMLSWCEQIAYLLLACSFLMLLCQKKAAVLLLRHPWLLAADVIVSVWILVMGGGWRSSCLGYTVTSIILCAIFMGRTETTLSTIGLVSAAVIKDPGGGLPWVQAFFR